MDRSLVTPEIHPTPKKHAEEKNVKRKRGGAEGETVGEKKNN